MKNPNPKPHTPRDFKPRDILHWPGIRSIPAVKAWKKREVDMYDATGTRMKKKKRR